MRVVEQIRQFALRTPEATAIIADHVPISYAELDRRISAQRRAFARRGLPAGANVVTAIGELAPGWIVDLALRSLGLNTIAISAPADIENLAGVEIAAVITSVEEAPAGFDSPEPPLAAEPGAHILLTSGTTGRFKLVRYGVEQESVSARAVETEEGPFSKIARGRVVSLFHFGLWTGAGYSMPPAIWSRGHAVVFHQGPVLHRGLPAQATHAMLTPSMLARLMAAPADAFPRNDDLEVHVFAGALSEALWRETCARLTSRVFTSIGATEGRAWGATQVLGPEDLRWHRVIPGRIVQVVDETHAPLPPGQMGQLRIGITTVEAYVNDKAANQTFFRDGFFYPGDLGVSDGDGRVALLGRVTDVINILGDKRPAGPIEAALEAELGVSAVCVLSEQASDASEVAHVVIEAESPIDSERLRAAASKHLPGFFRASFHFVSGLPRNHMGKIERLKLKRQLISERR
jgi:acyl-coenzyme A synthetase/AMP-(fatty) acid ligase